jgi:hypothetical protein
VAVHDRVGRTSMIVTPLIFLIAKWRWRPVPRGLD